MYFKKDEKNLFFKVIQMEMSSMNFFDFGENIF